MKNQEIKEFTDRGIKIVETLLNEKKYLDALSTCKEILQVDPQNSKTKRLLKKAEEKIEKEKEEIFKRNLPVLKNLYKKGEYEKVIAIGEKLKKITQNKTLTRIIAKCKSKLEQKELNALKTYLKNGFEKHKLLAKQENWFSAIEVLTEMQSIAPKSEELKNLLRKDKIKYVNGQLRSDIKQEFLKEKKYENLYKFYQKLYSIFPGYQKLKKEIFALEKIMTEENRENKSAYVKESLDKIKNMLANKQFEEAVKASEETVIITKFKNKKAIQTYKKAVSENNTDTDKKLVGVMNKIVGESEEEFSKNPNGFMKI